MMKYLVEESQAACEACLGGWLEPKVGREQIAAVLAPREEMTAI